MFHYKIMSNENELIAIAKQRDLVELGTEWISPDLIALVDEFVGDRYWSYDLIKQAEFETYLAFGIREIKL